MKWRLLNQFGCPKGAWGRFIIRGMNIGHRRLWDWCLEQVRIDENCRFLDVGCGGGRMIRSLLDRYPSLRVDAVDVSAEAVAYSRKENRRYLGSRCRIEQSGAESLPYDDNSFDLVTTFESLYFWQDIRKGFAEIYRVLKDGGRLVIGLEAADPSDKTWSSRIEAMTIYAPQELRTHLLDCGFSSVRTEPAEPVKGGRLCVVARK